MPTGIYCIRNIANQKKYIGYSVDCGGRKNKHFHDLRYEQHSNPKLQNAYNKVGRDDFVFEILEEMPGASKRQLAKREMEFIALHDSWHNGYNCNAGGGYGSVKAKKFNWVNIHDGRTANASVLEMAGNFNLSNANLYKVTYGKFPTCGGWAIEGTDYKNRWKNRYKKTKVRGEVYHLINDFSKQEVTGTRKQISKLLNVNERILTKLIKHSFCFGWRHFDPTKDIPDYEI